LSYAEELPLFINRYGNLCTNIYDTDDSTARILTAAHDGIFDTDADAITDVTAAEDYPTNVQNIVSFMGESDFDTLFAYQKLNNDDSPFTTWYDFLTAVAMAPAFCDGIAGALYSRFNDEAMCARELAAFFAYTISVTNDFATELLAEDGVTVIAKAEQGLTVTEDTFCAATDN
jgi:hypothetical protein